MNRKTWTFFLLGLAAMVFLAQYALTQGCTPGYSNGSITVGDLVSMCVEQYPTPQTRTDVGIGEDVTMSISSWSGTAIFTDQYCNQTPVTDGPGTITWTVTGPGSVNPSVTEGVLSTILTIDMADADGVVTVFANCTDEYLAAPPEQKQKPLNEHIPTGLNPIAYSDKPPFQPWTNGTKLIGCKTGFVIQVQPQNVNFSKTNMQENMESDYTWTWPGGQPGTIPKFIVAVKPADMKVGNLTFPNLIIDIIGTYGTGYTDANITKGGNYVDFDKPNPTVPAQYQDKAGKWITFDATVTRPRHWTGNTQKGRCGFISAGTLWGGDQGPFQKPN